MSLLTACSMSTLASVRSSRARNGHNLSYRQLRQGLGETRVAVFSSKDWSHGPDHRRFSRCCPRACR
jgi:hypothetical protein